ncbi:MAG: hypothetical protein HY544_01055 [Candidatus Diapherotrites archaeon]|uniref:Uncharacterized protein n=1 Tax=Candidatus Iainarchaeum sp. TaxID=3101447 RepID=A0A8T3YK74_9ARCH|nr:hypothetical protein [Candidatus Diapherotrites archaeon]
MRGQISLEAVVAMALLLVVLAIVYIGVHGWDVEAGAVSDIEAQKADCASLHGAMAFVRDQPNAYIEVAISSDANLGASIIAMSGYYCYFYGPDVNARLVAGKVRVVNENGVVTVGNF